MNLLVKILPAVYLWKKCSVTFLWRGLQNERERRGAEVMFFREKTLFLFHNPLIKRSPEAVAVSDHRVKCWPACHWLCWWFSNAVITHEAEPQWAEPFSFCFDLQSFVSVSYASTQKALTPSDVPGCSPFFRSHAALLLHWHDLWWACSHTFSILNCSLPSHAQQFDVSHNYAHQQVYERCKVCAHTVLILT